MKYKDIVTIGNGTGQGVVLRALRKITELDRVTALVGVTDNGGHTGALRRELEVPAMGDVKTVISALTGETLWGQLFRHRFSRGRLKGISIGNLLLAALIEEGGSLFHGTRRIIQALDLKVNVFPISDTSAQIVSELADGSEVRGEWETITRKNRDVRIVGVHHEPELVIHHEVIKAIDDAAWIIICPGTLWLGIGSILVAPEINAHISQSKATVITIGNILTQPGVTDGLTMKGHRVQLEKILGRPIDYYIQHDRPLPENILKMYKSKGFRTVVNDFDESEQGLTLGDFVSREFLSSVDRVHYDPSRGFPHALRHSPSMLARILQHIAEVTSDTQFEAKVREDRYEIKDF